jgi:nucleoside-diphosphate-sugar epimerase
VESLQYRKRSAARIDVCGIAAGAGVWQDGNQGDTADPAGDVEATYADVAELECDIGSRPSTSIEDGIASFAKWYREYHRL